LATLPKILKAYRVDRILGYRQLPPNKERQIIFGWEEKNDLPAEKDLILCRPPEGVSGEITLSTKDDYASYFKAIVGCEMSELLEDSSHPRYSSMRIEKGFAINIARLLTQGTTFVWKETLEFSIIPEKIS
jgi:hypothetical protein